MKELLIHADEVSYEVTRPTKMAEPDVPESAKRMSLKNVLWARISVEKSDEANPKSIVDQAVADFVKVMGEVKADSILLYPYAHLLFGSEPASPMAAISLLKALEEALKAKGFTVHRAPFGYYKRFHSVCKGHPLSELSRELKAATEIAKEDAVSQAVKAEEALKSHWFMLDTDGSLHSLSIDGGRVAGFDFAKHPGLQKFAKYEMAKVRAAAKEPPHVRLMQQLELADYEPGSDPGNLRFYPKGRLVKSLLEQITTERIVDYGGMEVEAPIMYDYEHPALKSYLNRFPQRQYTIQTPNKKVFLRFAACFGQFLIASDMTISHKELPMKLYELTRYSFRVEKHGELTGLRRLRAFTMPDCHSFCADMDMAKKEFVTRFDLARLLQSDIGFTMPQDMELAIRITKDFWDANKGYVEDLVRRWGKPALIEMWDKQFFYFVLKYEFNFVDALDKAAALTTDQIDIENAKRYGIAFTDKEGKRQNPIILHMSPPGAIERVIYALLEKAHIEHEAGRPAMLPVWLSPVQARIIPVSKDQLDYCRKLLDSFKDVRIDLDDRDETLGKKIRDAEKEWIPAIIAVGRKEQESGKLSVRLREICTEGQKPSVISRGSCASPQSGKQVEMGRDEFEKWFRERTAGRPFRKLPLPRLLSKRPIFVG